MIIEVHIDKGGGERIEEIEISKIELLKHYAFSGYGQKSILLQLPRILGMFLHFKDYFDNSSLEENKFSKPEMLYHDPTEISHFSNLTGKAFADFLAKRIDQATHTLVYEGYILSSGGKFPKNESRTDLIGFIKNKLIFTIEAKGYSGRSYGDIEKAKRQAEPKNAEITANFCVASITYNLFKKVRCKYHDPILEDKPFDEKLFRELTVKYYSGFLDILSQTSIPKKIIGLKYGNKTEKFHQIDIFEFFRKDVLGLTKLGFELKTSKGFFLLITDKVRTFAIKGFDDSNLENGFLLISDDKNTYIDSDGIGLSFIDQADN